MVGVYAMEDSAVPPAPTFDQKRGGGKIGESVILRMFS